eukprot:COSAG02_NODE_1597_length_11762_cov_4.644002_10_plen_59_part_00
MSPDCHKFELRGTFLVHGSVARAKAIELGWCAGCLPRSVTQIARLCLDDWMIRTILYR